METGADVTEILRVTKWEPQLPLTGDVAGSFIPFVPKTDEMRIQSTPEVLSELRGLPYVITVKCDGTSATYGVNRSTGCFTACGRNWSIRRGPNAYWAAAEKYQLEEALLKHPHMVIQAELVGPGIQKNRLNLKEIQLVAFNAYDQQADRYLNHAGRRILHRHRSADGGCAGTR